MRPLVNGRTVGSAMAENRALRRCVHGVCEMLERRMLLSAVSWTGMGGDNQWTTPGNWSTGMLPGPSDDVTINVAGNPTINLNSGAQSINSLNAVNNLQINAGSLSLAAGSQMSNLTVADGSLLLVHCHASNLG